MGEAARRGSKQQRVTKAEYYRAENQRYQFWLSQTPEAKAYRLLRGQQTIRYKEFYQTLSHILNPAHSLFNFFR